MAFPTTASREGFVSPLPEASVLRTLDRFEVREVISGTKNARGDVLFLLVGALTILRFGLVTMAACQLIH